MSIHKDLNLGLSDYSVTMENSHKSWFLSLDCTACVKQFNNGLAWNFRVQAMCMHKSKAQLSRRNLQQNTGMQNDEGKQDAVFGWRNAPILPS